MWLQWKKLGLLDYILFEIGITEIKFEIGIMEFLGARRTYPIMDLIAISAPDFGFNLGENGGFWILLPLLWI